MTAPRVAVGPSTVAGGGVTLAAFIAAAIAALTGARDAVTLSTLAAGVLVLVTTLLGRFHQASAAVTAAGWSQPIEPADQGDQLPDDVGPDPGLPDYLPHTGPLPPDEGDPGPAAVPGWQPSTLGFSARQRTSGLSPRDQAMARRLLLKGAALLMDHANSVHYTQDMVGRWEAIHDAVVPWTSAGRLNGRFLHHGDCSSTVTWLYWLALHHHFGLPDIVNGEEWHAGFTGTLLDHGVSVPLPHGRPGDLVLYGRPGTSGEHVAMKIGADHVFSHGGEAGPFILPWNYRSDVIDQRRYL